MLSRDIVTAKMEEVTKRLDDAFGNLDLLVERLKANQKLDHLNDVACALETIEVSINERLKLFSDTNH